MRRLPLAALAAAILAVPANAHFQEILPSTDTFEPADGEIAIELVFTHPMEMGPAMAMERPARFGVLTGNGEADLLDTLTTFDVDGQPAWRTSYVPQGPDNLIFFVEPQPYWEPAEGKSIIHYAKVVVDAFDWGDGWAEPVGLPVEIIPLARPYGLWTGNVFSGIVLADGEPVPFAEIEVEWKNDGSVTPPSGAYVTQVIQADANGTFHYGLPRAGWWGFAALIEADDELPNPEGDMMPVELGGLIWVQARTME